MNSIFLSHEMIQTLGWALLHFLWQGALIGLCLKLVIVAMQRSSAQARYVAGCFGMLALALAPILTFVVLEIQGGDLDQGPSGVAWSSDGPSVLVRAGIDAPGDLHASAAHSGVQEWMAPRIPWFMAFWSCGVLFLSIRLLVGWQRTLRFAKSGVLPTHRVPQRLVEKISAALKIGHAVRVLVSDRMDVPATIGWLRPVVLLPVGTLMGLTPGQLEAVLAHELAHIRRRDYLVNLLQCWIEALLFYHPVVWWVSRQIRVEREHCCDDLVLAAGAERLEYARALVRLEEQRAGNVLTLAATDGALSKRVQRLVYGQPERSSSGFASALLILIAAISFVLALSRLPASAGAAAEPVPAPKFRPSDANPAPSRAETLPATIDVEAKFFEVPAYELADLEQEIGSRQSVAIPLSITNRTSTLRHSEKVGGDQKLPTPVDSFKTDAEGRQQTVSPGSARILSPEASDKLQKRLKDWLQSTAHVTTWSGQQARIQITEVKTVVTGLDTAPGHVNYLTDKLPIGPSIDLVPKVLPDRKGIDLVLIPSIVEFLGYDDPGSFVPQVGPSSGQAAQPLTAVLPLPRFRARQAVCNLRVPEGQVVMIGGFGESNPRKPELTKQLVILLTPRVMEEDKKLPEPKR
jgi:beta-lactamase regulating signal transducer with metallopeptidase domain